MYWRLLSSSPEIAKRVVMGEKPAITAEESEKLDPATLEEMCLNVGTLATVYLKPVNQVFRSARPRKIIESPALQRHTLPTVRAAKAAREKAAAERPSVDTSATNGNGAAHNGNGNGNGNGNLAAAVSEADMYFANLSAGQHMRESAFGGSPIAGNSSSMYVVTQNAPQGIVQSPGGAGGGDGGGDLLLL